MGRYQRVSGMPFRFTADQQRFLNPFPKPQSVSKASRSRSPNISLTFYGKWGGSRGRPSRLRQNRCMTCICMQVCALHSPPVRYGGTSLVCRRWCDYRTKKNLVLHHISIRITRKKQSCRYQPAPYASQTICYDSFYSRSGLPYLFMNLPALY